jgi:hypothetical protein
MLHTFALFVLRSGLLASGSFCSFSTTVQIPYNDDNEEHTDIVNMKFFSCQIALTFFTKECQYALGCNAVPVAVQGLIGYLCGFLL